MKYNLWSLPALVWSWISSEWQFRSEMATRPPLDVALFYRQLYKSTDIPEDIPRRLKPIYGRFFNLDVTKLRPADRPPEIAERDNSVLIREIEEEFGMTFSDRDLERINGSFDSIVQYLAKHRARTEGSK